jgi:RHS repeat-associated protein
MGTQASVHPRAVGYKIRKFESFTAIYSYDEFGNLMAKSGTLNQPFQFSTAYDEKIGLSYYGYRFYSPVQGKWITRDPIGFAGGDLNLYRFVGNNAINFYDEDGRFIPPPIAAIGVTG